MAQAAICFFFTPLAAHKVWYFHLRNLMFVLMIQMILREDVF
jgi:hypothetical protein